MTNAFTDRVWLKDANCFGLAQWRSARDAAADLQSGQRGLTDGSSSGDWRLPLFGEWEETLADGCDDPPKIKGSETSTCYSPFGWAFDVQDGYWSLSDSGGSASAWFASMLTGGLTLIDKTSEASVWPVRGGQ